MLVRVPTFEGERWINPKHITVLIPSTTERGHATHVSMVDDDGLLVELEVQELATMIWNHEYEWERGLANLQAQAVRR